MESGGKVVKVIVPISYAKVLLATRTWKWRKEIYIAVARIVATTSDKTC